MDAPSAGTCCDRVGLNAGFESMPHVLRFASGHAATPSSRRWRCAKRGRRGPYPDRDRLTAHWSLGGGGRHGAWRRDRSGRRASARFARCGSLWCLSGECGSSGCGELLWSTVWLWWCEVAGSSGGLSGWGGAVGAALPGTAWTVPGGLASQRTRTIRRSPPRCRRRRRQHLLRCRGRAGFQPYWPQYWREPRLGRG